MEMKLGFDVENLSPFKRRLLIILPSLAIIAFFLSLFIFPTLEEISKLKAEVQRQKDEIALLKRHSERLPTLMSENERLQRRLLELQMQLPEEREVSDLLKQVTILGTKSGLQVMTWKPKPKNIHPSKEVYEIPVDVEMRGSYHNFGQFFSSLTKLSRIVNLSDINIKIVDPKGPQGLQVNFITTTYSIIPEIEKKQIEEKRKS
ncbi:MAG: type 4a pilus biogenesis protein PilO [Thermodesulfovibrionales bacterium]|nr:type 4a pilus biogenesis protein PilO [Thermodesulfovibrionales bacterium]